MNENAVTIIRWANKCNNRCVMCSVHSGADRAEELTFEEAKEQIRKNAPDHRHIEFTGGEPTVREGVIDLIKFAKECGYKQIGISTNGRRLANKEYSDALVGAGLNYATIAVHGHDAETHEKMTDAKGSFEEGVQGIKNLLATGATVSVASVMNRFNHQTFHKIGELLLDIRVSFWAISDLIPDGRAKDIYEELCVSPREKEQSLLETVPVFMGVANVSIFNFPRCYLPQELPKHVFFFDTKSKMELWNVKGVDGKYKKEGDVYQDVHKAYIPMCLDCSKYESCGGFFKKELELFGPEEAEGVARRNGF